MTRLDDVTRLALTTVLVVAIAPSALGQGPRERRDARPGLATAGNGQVGTTPAGPDTNPLATALLEFDRRLKAYLALREELERTLKPLSPTADSTELAARQRALAGALREARKGAKPGDIVPTAVAGQIRSVFAADVRRRNVDATRAVYQEVPNRVRPVINSTMPDNTALATVPPLLLSNLPPLPDNLQYRFLDRHVVLMDGDTRIIVDFILNVLPPH